MKENEKMFTTYFDIIFHLDLVVYCGFYLIIIEGKSFALLTKVALFIIVLLYIYRFITSKLMKLISKIENYRLKSFTAPQIFKPEKIPKFGIFLQIKIVFINYKNRKKIIPF